MDQYEYLWDSRRDVGQTGRGLDTLSTNDNVHTQYSRELNLAKTRESAAETIFFATTVYGTEDGQFPTPRMEEDAVMPSPKKP